MAEDENNEKILATAVERYVVGGPRDGYTSLIVGDFMIIPAEGGRPEHRYRVRGVVFKGYGVMHLLVSEDLSDDQARTLVFRRVLGGWPGVMSFPVATKDQS